MCMLSGPLVHPTFVTLFRERAVGFFAFVSDGTFDHCVGCAIRKDGTYNARFRDPDWGNKEGEDFHGLWELRRTGKPSLV